MDKFKISTITMSMQVPDCNLNLINIGKYLEIDNHILGIKYNYGKSSILKGKYSTSIYKKSKIKNQNKINQKLFYNQVSIIVSLDPPDNSKVINVKLFGNGTLHMTGVKNPSEGKEVMLLLYNKLLDLIKKEDTILLTADINNVYLDNDNNVYTQQTDDRTVIGFKYQMANETLYNIHKKDYVIDKKTGLFISKKFESKRSKHILNFNGIKVGTSRIELLKNKSKLYKNNSNVNFDYDSGFIYYDGDGKSNIIGKIIYEFTDDYKHDYKQETNQQIVVYKYNCNPFFNDSKIYTIDELEELSNEQLEYDINCINIYLNLEFELNRQRLFNELIKRKFISEYKPEKYSGVKLRYKLSKSSQLSSQNHGICQCTCKCTCSNITFLIFQSGNIIVTGFKSVEEIEEIVDRFKNLVEELKPIIKKKTLV